jgi:hypothetical protein
MGREKERKREREKEICERNQHRERK